MSHRPVVEFPIFYDPFLNDPDFAVARIANDSMKARSNTLLGTFDNLEKELPI